MSGSDVRDRIDATLRNWRQGDCALGEQWFLYRLDVDAPLTEAAVQAASEGTGTCEAEVRGLMAATQTCDIVRSCGTRQFVEVCPLVEVKPDRIVEIRRGRRPNYAYVPGVAEHGLVADLDRVMTVEKAVVAGWERTEGCRDDSERRRLALALARKRARIAFPDDFVELVRALTQRMISKHDKDSDEGRALRALREIRVRAAPSWDSGKVKIMFWFIREDEYDFEGRSWDDLLDAWLNRVPARDRFVSVDGVVQTLDDLTARDYVESDPLDLDHLSL